MFFAPHLSMIAFVLRVIARKSSYRSGLTVNAVTETTVISPPSLDIHEDGGFVGRYDLSPQRVARRLFRSPTAAWAGGAVPAPTADGAARAGGVVQVGAAPTADEAAPAAEGQASPRKGPYPAHAWTGVPRLPCAPGSGRVAP